jgi:hypothetical protein
VAVPGLARHRHGNHIPRAPSIQRPDSHLAAEVDQRQMNTGVHDGHPPTHPAAQSSAHAQTVMLPDHGTAG